MWDWWRLALHATPVNSKAETRKARMTLRPRKTNHSRSSKRNLGQVSRSTKHTAKKRKAKLPNDRSPIAPTSPPTVNAPHAPLSTTHYSVDASSP